jgi:sugar phosphate isomerase/epimerase
MIVDGFPKVDVEVDLAIAAKIGAEVVEVLPNWRSIPDPVRLARLVADRGLRVHSAHGCWGGQSIRAARVDLGHNDPKTWAESVADLRHCVDWLASAGGRCLVVHPGGLSDPEDVEARRDALTRGLDVLADHAAGTGVILCVENMPPGVHPGSRMADLRAIVEGLGRAEIGLALDTGHAHIAASSGSETLAAGPMLRTTHVHDNDGRQDVHLPPGLGSVDWGAWVAALDAVEYRGPIVLECIKHLRDRPASVTAGLVERLRQMCGLERS